MKKYLFLFALLGTTCLAQVTVKLGSPTNGSSVTAPVELQASASSSRAITGWHAYLDGQSVYTAGTAGSISGSFSAAAGTHQLVVRAWDSSGAYGDQTVNITVSGSGSSPAPPPAPPSGALPTPPTSAKVFTNLDQQSSGWTSCKTASCAGGSGSGNYWQAFFQTSPSMDGSSMEIYRDGVWANALWIKKTGANNGVTNLLWDFYFRVDSASTSATQALEFDAFQFVGGYNYMIGSQCDYGNGHWDTWSEAGGHWVPTSVACPKFSPNTWHHIQWYETVNHANHSYTYKTLVVDGKAYALNQTQYAKNLGWGDNLGVQWQLDVNASGNGYHEWVDKAKLTVW